MSTLVYRAFFLMAKGGEKAQTVELLHRVEVFSGVIVLAYAIMFNHFHSLIYVPGSEDIGEDGLLQS